MKDLTNQELQDEAIQFVKKISSIRIEDLNGVTDGKAVGTYLEKHFKEALQSKYTAVNWGNSAKGVDLPTVNTDIKFTSYRQPQSSLPYRDSKQKIFGLGYNIVVFVYNKQDDQEHNISFTAVDFIEAKYTADYLLTNQIRDAIINHGANDQDLYALLEDRNLPGDDITYNQIISEIRQNIPEQGYLTISNALQWRAQYARVIKVAGKVQGVHKLYG